MKSATVSKKTGTKEWSDYSRNIQLGCSHGCKYCYACSMATRFHRVKDAKNWMDPKLNKNGLKEKPKKLNGRIMFPTTHDITKDNIVDTIEYLKKWLALGNEFLIVSKPNPECVTALVYHLLPWKKQITFRFTIGSIDDRVLRFWEPYAPSFENRMTSLCIAHGAGFKTSVSIEPMLDTTAPLVVMEVLPYVTDSVWLGKMNDIARRVSTEGWTDGDMDYLRVVEDINTDDKIKILYNTFKDNPKVKWKDSIKKVLNLPEEAIG